MLLVSPAEPKPFFQLGRSTQLPEKYGSDFLFASDQIGLIGIQRKQFPEDFLASLRGNDRVSRELQQMKRLDMGVWLFEGIGNWTNDGYLVYGGRYKYTLPEFWGFIASVYRMGYAVVCVRNQTESIQFLHYIQQWARKDQHDSLLNRPKPGQWGAAGTREWALHFLQGLPGIGYTKACKILDHFAGKLPFKADFEFEDLRDATGPAGSKVICELFGVEVKQKVKIRTVRGSSEQRGRIV